MLFIRYPAHSKGYVMYGEHSNGGVIEIESHNVDFLKVEFPSIGEIKKDLQLYEVFLCTPLEIDEPTSFKEAFDSPNHKEWMDAMKDEMDSIAKNKV